MPIQTPSSNYIIALDSKIISDLCAGSFLIDATPSVYTAQGISGMKGGKVKIIYKAGALSQVIIKDFSNSFDFGGNGGSSINQVFSLPIPKLLGVYRYGVYFITVSVTDNDNKVFEITKTISISYPDVKNPLNDYRNLSLIMRGICKQGRVSISAAIPDAYNGKSYQSGVYSYAITFPPTSNHAVLNSASANLYVPLFDGLYSAIGDACVLYNMTDNVFVKIKHKISTQKQVRCGVDLTCVFLKLDELNKKIESNCISDHQREDYSSIALEALLLLKTAEIAANTDEDPTPYILQLEKLLNIGGEDGVCDDYTSLVYSNGGSGGQGCGYELLDELLVNTDPTIISVTSLEDDLSSPTCKKIQKIYFDTNNAYLSIKSKADGSSEFAFWSSIINKTLNLANPSSLGYTSQNWSLLTFLAKIQAIIDAAGAGIFTLSELRTKSNLINGKSYIISDYGGGEWYVDAADTTSADNTVTCIINTPSGLRLKRKYDGVSINIKWCGANVGYDFDNHTLSDESKDDIVALELGTNFVEYGGFFQGHKAARLYFDAMCVNVSRTWRPPSYCLVEGVNSSTYIYALNQNYRNSNSVKFQGEFIIDTNKAGWEEFQIRNLRLHCRDTSINRYTDGDPAHLIPKFDGTGYVNPTTNDYLRQVNSDGSMKGGIGGLRIGACRNSTFEYIWTDWCNGIAGVQVKVTHPQGMDVENLGLSHIYTIHSAGFEVSATINGTGGIRGNITDMQVRDCQFTTHDLDVNENSNEVWPVPVRWKTEAGNGSVIFGLHMERFIAASKNNSLLLIDGEGGLGGIVGSSINRMSVEMQGIGFNGFDASGVTPVPAFIGKNIRDCEFKNMMQTIVPGHGFHLFNVRNCVFDNIVFKNKSESDNFNNNFIHMDAQCSDNHFGRGINFVASIEEDYTRQRYARSAGNFFGGGSNGGGAKIIDLGVCNTFDTPLVKTEVALLNSVPDFLATNGVGGMKYGWGDGGINGDGSINGDGRSDTVGIQCTTNSNGNLEIYFPPDHDTLDFFTVNLGFDDAYTQRSGIVIKFRFIERVAGFAFQLYGQRPDIYDVPTADFLYFSVACPKKPVDLGGGVPNYDVKNPFMSFTAYRTDDPRLGPTIIEIAGIWIGLDAIPYMPNLVATPYLGGVYTREIMRQVKADISAATLASVFSYFSSSHTITIDDRGKDIEMDLAVDGTVTIPLNSTVPHIVGTNINIRAIGIGVVTIQPEVGVSILSADGALTLRTRYSVCTITKKSTDTWYLEGDLI